MIAADKITNIAHRLLRAMPATPKALRRVPKAGQKHEFMDGLATCHLNGWAIWEGGEWHLTRKGRRELKTIKP